MRKKQLLFGLAILPAVYLASGTETSAAKFTFNAFYFGPKHTSFTKKRWYPYLDAIEKASGGQIKFKRMHGFSVLPPPKIYDGLARGIVHVAYTPTVFTPGRFKRTQMLMLPGLARDRVTGAKIANEILRLHAHKDFPEVAMPIFDYSGPRELWTTKKPIRKLSDLKGLRVRYYGAWKKPALLAVGAIPTTMPAPERFMALERGLLDGTLERSTTVEPFGIQEVIRHRITFNMGGAITVIPWNKGAWNKIGPDLQAKIKAASIKAAIDPIAEMGQHDDINLARNTWAKKYGLKNIDPSQEELAKWQKIIRPLWQRWADKLESDGVNGKEMLAEVLRVQKKHGEPAYVPYVKP
ncbi:MAG: TRAP transporter substrate-binding protein DctP [Rhodospirillales bacterium]|jgi:TRAP-type C4-dicarboxylate transport system substrate-binding protein|nr:TRAP transporter substrate-binding protein DctP [Rhodospirillales bacterium]MDP6646765.1 TRAP transporter substrate-binding protein DctP [Rhodospirillales bacterium]MDP6843470.1 TRAP transporter substrate-binding protein DctP [Rhodospirillales bacterium]|tara:strand:- start:125 stop:1180 length:1056 start_codon:yes stop_codon:yes gene_type:complete